MEKSLVRYSLTDAAYEREKKNSLIYTREQGDFSLYFFRNAYKARYMSMELTAPGSS